MFTKMSSFSLHRFLLITCVCFFFTNAFSSTNKEEKEFNVGEMIMHHVKDAHEWHLWGPEHGGTSIYLPVILYDNGLKMFSSCHLACSTWVLIQKIFFALRAKA